jgi:hypothetical protein
MSFRTSMLLASLATFGVVGLTPAYGAVPVPGDHSTAPLAAPIRLQHGQLPSGVAARPFVPRPSGMPRNSHANVATAALPTWTASFDYGGSSYSYTIVGRAPQLGGTTRIDSVILPIYIFLGYLEDGRPVYFDGTSKLGRLLASPMFNDASYATGDTQFQDAVQRASFGRVAKPGWHTLMSRPRVLTTLALEIPPQFYTLYEFADSGTLFLEIDEAYWLGLVEALAKAVDVNANQLLMLVTDNVGTTEGLGFHFFGWKLLPDLSGYVPQTFLWGSWLSSDLEPFTDTVGFSHELGEWMNDPYSSNLVPQGQIVGAPPGNCLPFLETADPFALLDNARYAVPMAGFNYHMVNQATLAWFSRQALADSPSLAYSFPDTTLAAGPSTPCSF